jgi:hypothetical protein
MRENKKIKIKKEKGKMDKQKYLWGWYDEGCYWNAGKTIQDCLEQAIREVLVQYSPEDFIAMMEDKGICVYVFKPEHRNKDGYYTDPITAYRLAMSGQWNKIKSR